MLRGGEVILLFLPLTFNCKTKCEVNVRLTLIYVRCIPNKILQIDDNADKCHSQTCNTVVNRVRTEHLLEHVESIRACRRAP